MNFSTLIFCYSCRLKRGFLKYFGFISYCSECLEAKFVCTIFMCDYVCLVYEMKGTLPLNNLSAIHKTLIVPFSHAYLTTFLPVILPNDLTIILLHPFFYIFKLLLFSICVWVFISQGICVWMYKLINRLFPIQLNVTSIILLYNPL